MNLVLSSLVFFVFTTLIANAEKYKNKLSSAWKQVSAKSVQKITVSGRISKKNSGYVSVCSEFTDNFKAVLHLLSSMPDAWSHASALSEIPAAYSHDYEWSKTELLGDSGSVVKLPRKTAKGDIWCKIVLTTKELNSDNRTDASIQTNISFELYSRTLGLHDLKEYLVIGARPEHVPADWVTDHINRVQNDSSRPNLRWVSLDFNSWNIEYETRSSSFRGVSWNQPRKKWVVFFLGK